MTDDPKQFPSGKIVPSDEGALTLRMGIKEASGTAGRTLIVDFGKDVSWIGFDKQSGTKFAEQFLKGLADL